MAQNPQLSQADAASYNKLKQEYGQIFKVFTDLEEEKKEHSLVLEAIKDLEPSRKSWRLVGSAMVERTVGEIIPALKQNIEMITKTVEAYGSNLKTKEKEIMDFELKFVPLHLTLISDTESW